MENAPYSVEQVANLLGLHVKTVRGYVRDGKLKAVKIGKQYRIPREELEKFSGGPVPPPAAEAARRRRHAEVTSVVQIDAISRDGMSRLSTVLTALGGPLNVQIAYDEERASMKVVIIGGLEDAAETLRIIGSLVKETQ